MKLGKRQFVIAALVAALGAAVYLNWQFSANDSLLADTSERSESSESTETSEDSSKEIGEAKYVNTSVSEKSESSQTLETSEISEESLEAEEKSEYFAQAELNRKQAQDEETELLNDIIDDSEKSDSAKAEAVKQLSEISERIEQQNNIESLIKAKGFKECIAFISNGECSVVVSQGSVTNAGAITIKDIVHSQSGIDYSKITITEESGSGE